MSLTSPIMTLHRAQLSLITASEWLALPEAYKLMGLIWMCGITLDVIGAVVDQKDMFV
jgi:hypothetical protein